MPPVWTWMYLEKHEAAIILWALPHELALSRHFERAPQSVIFAILDSLTELRLSGN